MARSVQPWNEILVSVVIPAFNAESTLRETVSSALSQTHQNIEVLIVDDGSTDATRAVAAALRQEDARVRCIHKNNGGVASARNAGIAEASGRFVATLDADDLWYPTKLERQLQRFETKNSQTALVYAWCCWIDDQSNVIGSAPPIRLEGQIFPQMCLGNIVISGSNALIKRQALIDVGGFDETLCAQGGQGCEDLKLYLKIAERHEIAMVPEYLIGYRISAGSMSDDFEQMMRSRRLVEAEFVSSYPELASQFARGDVILARSLALRAIERGQYREALSLLLDQSRTVSAGLATFIWLAEGSTRRLAKWLRRDIFSTHSKFLPRSDQHAKNDKHRLGR